MKVLLLGATGFAGRHFLAAARNADLDVVSSSRSGTADVSCDLLDPASLEQVLQSVRPDTIVNLAGASSVGASWRDPEIAFKANAFGVLHILEACRRRSPDAHIVCISSGEVYGELSSADLPATEMSHLRPASPYASSKLAAEVLCDQYARSVDLSIAVVRAFNHVGPGQSDNFAASSFARQIAEAELAGATKVSLTAGDLSPVRDFTDVRDTVNAYRLIVEHRLTGTYNVCSGMPVALTALVDLLAGGTKLEVEVAVDEARIRPRETRVAYGTYDRLRQATGWSPSRSLARSMADVLEWWREELHGREELHR